MSGIAGYIGEQAKKYTDAMCGVMTHRGPDAQGVFRDGDLRAIGHRRLGADTDATNDQPMTSRDGRYVIALDGRIYNHMELRDQTRRAHPCAQYKGLSDTESLLEAISVLGLSRALELSIGAFALCVYDKMEKVLYLVRDRAGEKPLYYGKDRGAFFFMSDLNALRSIGVRPPIDREALRLYCSYGYYPAPYTVFEGIYKVRAGHILTLKSPAVPPTETPYWDAYSATLNALGHPFQGSMEEATDALDTLLRESIRGQMDIGAAPGAFLSGGVDSSLVTAVMRELSGNRIKTFSIGFKEDRFNEAIYAKAVAEYLGTDHTEWYITAQDAMDVIRKIPEMYAEPFADSSQIPTHLVSKLARQQVSAVLTGDAGDELFGGYDSYKALALAERIPFRRPLGNIAMWMAKTPAGYLSNRNLLDRGGRLLAAKDQGQAYQALRRLWQTRSPVVLKANGTYSCVVDDLGKRLEWDSAERFMMHADFLMGLPDDMLVKVDRAAMAVSLETRVPLLDKRIIEFAWSLPLDYRIHNGVRKWPLRQLLFRYIPREFIERPKQGFGIPVHMWLAGPLRDWAEDLLDEKKIREQGWLDSTVVRRGWRHFLSSPKDSGMAIWFILMFQGWVEWTERMGKG